MTETIAADNACKLIELTGNHALGQRDHEAVIVAVDGEKRRARLLSDSIMGTRWKLHVLPGSELRGDQAFTGDLDITSSGVHSIDYSAYVLLSDVAVFIETLGAPFDLGARFVEYPHEIRALSNGSKFTYRMHCFFGEAYRLCAVSSVGQEQRAVLDRLYQGWRDYHELMIIKYYPAWWPQDSRG
jgi:hypothetical protein